MNNLLLEMGSRSCITCPTMMPFMGMDSTQRNGYTCPGGFLFGWRWLIFDAFDLTYCSRLPYWLQAVTPRVFYIIEKAWNYYPYTEYVYLFCEFFISGLILSFRYVLSYPGLSTRALSSQNLAFSFVQSMRTILGPRKM